MNLTIAEKTLLLRQDFDEVYAKGKTDGAAEGYESGYTEGNTAGYTKGYTEGYDAGYAEGEASGGSDFPVDEYFAKTATELTLTGVTKIWAYTIYQQNALEALYLPDATVLDSNAISTCSDLSTVVMGEGLITIGGAGTSVIVSCPNIKSLEIPSTVETIAWNAFIGCTNLETVTFLGKPTTIGTTFNKTLFPTSVKTINVPWAEGEVEGFPWGATKLENINYGYVKEE